MSFSRLPSRLFFIFLGGLPLSIRAEGNLNVGKRFYRSVCANCHVIAAESTPSGPSLVGIAGRQVAAAKDFAYSDGMKTAQFVWTDEKLLSYLKSPTEVVPGTTMTGDVPKATDRENILAYLKSLASPD